MIASKLQEKALIASSWDHWGSRKGNGMQNPGLNKTYPAIYSLVGAAKILRKVKSLDTATVQQHQRTSNQRLGTRIEHDLK